MKGHLKPFSWCR